MLCLSAQINLYSSEVSAPSHKTVSSVFICSMSMTVHKMTPATPPGVHPGLKMTTRSSSRGSWEWEGKVGKRDSCKSGMRASPSDLSPWASAHTAVGAACCWRMAIRNLLVRFALCCGNVCVCTDSEHAPHHTLNLACNLTFACLSSDTTPSPTTYNLLTLTL